jgi:hypothetical protein
VPCMKTSRLFAHFSICQVRGVSIHSTVQIAPRIAEYLNFWTFHPYNAIKTEYARARGRWHLHPAATQSTHFNMKPRVVPRVRAFTNVKAEYHPIMPLHTLSDSLKIGPIGRQPSVGHNGELLRPEHLARQLQ